MFLFLKKEKQPHPEVYERKRLTLSVLKESVPINGNQGTFELVLHKPVGFTFRAGQSMKFCFEGLIKDDGSPREPSFTIASAPEEPHLRFVFRRSDSILKKRLLGLSPGDTVTMRDVKRWEDKNEAVYPDEATERNISVVMLAGGVGIAPFRSMLMHAEAVGDARPFRLLYANPTAHDITYKDELDTLAGTSQTLDLSVTYFLTREYTTGFSRGHFSREALENAENEFDHTALFYVTGTPTMVAETSALLKELGVEDERIRIKKFTGYDAWEDDIESRRPSTIHQQARTRF